DSLLSRTKSEQGVIEVAVKIKIRHIYYIPAGRESRPVSASSKNVVVHVPDCRASRAPVEKHIIRFPVAVKISGRQQCPTAGRLRGANRPNIIPRDYHIIYPCPINRRALVLVKHNVHRVDEQIRYAANEEIWKIGDHNSVLPYFDFAIA